MDDNRRGAGALAPRQSRPWGLGHGDGSCADLPVTRQAVVKHLGVLKHAGLVVAHKHGREVYFAVRPERLDAIAHWLAAMSAAWDTRLAAIKHLAERERDE